MLNELTLFINNDLPTQQYHIFGICLRFILFTNLYFNYPAFYQNYYIRCRHFFSFTQILTTYISGTVYDCQFFDIDHTDPDILKLMNVLLPIFQLFFKDAAAIYDLKKHIRELKGKIQKNINEYYTQLVFVNE